MFTGIIEETGLMKQIHRGAKSSVLTIQGTIIFDDLKIGDSVAVNGVCLTVTNRSVNTFTADAVPETLKRSSLNYLTEGSSVNLERAMPLKGRFGGHIVSGHIDGTGMIQKLKREDNAVWFTIRCEPSILRYIVEKGSVAIDGISLTVADVSSEGFRVSVIPHTIKATTLSCRSAGDIVNLENDVIGKYLEKLAGMNQSAKIQSKITKEFLLKSGY